MRSGRHLNQEMPSEKVEILVVDDELLIRDLLYDFFTSQGYIVHLAENGRKALEMIDEINFQIAILDLKMPEVDGIQVTSVLYQKKPYIPVIIMTAYPSIDSAIESIRKGVYDYIIKPFKMSELLIIVEKAIEEYQFRTKSGHSKTKVKTNSPKM